MTIRRHIPISRRTLLRGAGASLALPWLEGMNALGATPRSPVRMAILYMPNGVREDMWTPQGTGPRGFTLSPTLEPLADLKDELVIATNLWNQAAKGSEGHYVKTSGFLTCTTVSKTLGVDINCHGISMDQVAAKATGERTPIASLELGTAPVATGVDTNVGYTRVYGSHIAWGGPTSPVAKEINPRFVYERLLRATRPQTNAAKDDLLLLDQVQDDARQLRGQLGAADKLRLDEYLSVVRALEVRVERTGNLHHTKWKPRALAKGMPDPAGPPQGMPKQHAEHVRLMLDMIALAFQTDTTRIATFMFGNAVSNENFGFLEGVTGAHHSLSHHQNDADKLRQYQLINRWHVDQYAYLLRKLRAVKEGERSLLDSSMIVLGAGLRDGNKHDPHNLPIVLAGRAGGRIATGQHLTYTPDTPLANFWMSMLDAFGTPVERFADSTGCLAGVLA
ncbi:MAG TPA: DUF1552 domain-containing protein [Candidatus Acidoferrales bacterium]|nr:DUF1552 domain-containing protein [Candidatus Acidoferrales bacterium]